MHKMHKIPRPLWGDLGYGLTINSLNPKKTHVKQRSGSGTDT